MTTIMLDIPEQVLDRYREKRDDLHRTGSKTTLPELLVNTLTLHTVQAPRPGGPGATLHTVNPPFTPNEYTLLAHDEPADFPSGAGY